MDTTPVVEAETVEQKPAAPSLTTWVVERPRAAVIAITVLAVPYLLICVGLALAFVVGMSGGCGG